MRLFALLLSTVLASGATLPASQPDARATLFSLGDVTLLDGPFQHAHRVNREYILSHDPERLLAPFRKAAGLPGAAIAYPNWESQGLAGHTAGHYLTALAQLVAVDADTEARQRLVSMVAALGEIQEAGGDGYVAGVPGDWWRKIEAGQLAVEPFSVNGAWVPWYNLHKTFAGLRDAYELAGIPQARDVLVRLADWCERLAGRLDDTQMQEMLRAEHGGMNEVLADVYRITGDERYLALARRFNHRAVLDPLGRGEDRLDGLHANTQIPKVIGAARIATLSGTPEGLQLARFFWDTVVHRRSVAFGGNSVREHFNSPSDFGPMLASAEGPETCNTYNMLRLSELLFEDAPQASLADYYERALFNHILSSQHPDHGGFVYFTPIRPQHYRVYSKAEACFWCCVGSGIESHGKHGRFIYAQGRDGALFVNLFIASELSWKARGITVRQETRFPDEERSSLVFSMPRAQAFPLFLRHPEWLAGDHLTVHLNGNPLRLPSQPGAYARLERTWEPGDRLEVTLPMRSHLEALPDGSPYAAFVHGPIVLAAATDRTDLTGLVAGDARMGHVADGPFRPLAQAPMLVGTSESLVSSLTRKPTADLRFTTPAIEPPPTEGIPDLIPFFRVHDARYMLYWRVVSPEALDSVRAGVAAEEASRLALARRTLDQVTPGEQQPEVEHGYEGSGSGTGVHQGRSWRDASERFSYRLKARPGAKVGLRFTTYGGERGRQMVVQVNGTTLARVSPRGEKPDTFVDHEHPLPDGSAGDETVTVTFSSAAKGTRTPRIYDVRLVELP